MRGSPLPHFVGVVAIDANARFLFMPTTYVVINRANNGRTAGRIQNRSIIIGSKSRRYFERYGDDGFFRFAITYDVRFSKKVPFTNNDNFAEHMDIE